MSSQKELAQQAIDLYEKSRQWANESATREQALLFKLAKSILSEDLHEPSYRQGYVDAITNYAKWKNGTQLVGALETPLKTVVAEFETFRIPVRY